MPYRTGAQGPQSSAGAQGPTLQGTSGSQSPWGTQGPVAGKRPPFSVNGSGFNLTGSLFMMLSYTHSNGKTFAIFIERDVPAGSDLLGTLPDDIVQMCNLIDFRPQQGTFKTKAGGHSIEYKVVEMTGSDLIDKIKSRVAASDTNTSPRYTPNEVGL